MRSCTLHVTNLWAIACTVCLRFDDVPDTGRSSSIINVVAKDEGSALIALREAINGRILNGSYPEPITVVYDQEGLRSLTVEHLEQAAHIDVPFGFKWRCPE